MRRSKLGGFLELLECPPNRNIQQTLSEQLKRLETIKEVNNDSREVDYRDAEYHPSKEEYVPAYKANYGTDLLHMLNAKEQDLNEEDFEDAEFLEESASSSSEEIDVNRTLKKIKKLKKANHLESLSKLAGGTGCTGFFSRLWGS